MLRNIDLKTAHYLVMSKTSNSTLINGLRMGVVPAGMTRWITFLYLDSQLVTKVSTCRLHIASLASVGTLSKASIMLAANRKMLLDLRGTGLLATHAHCAPYGLPPLMIPPVPDPDKPLFSIAGGHQLGLYCSCTTANVFIQYFDE